MARTVSDVDVHSISIEDIFALEELSFNETSREKTSIFVDARHLLSQWVVGFGGLHLSAQVENKNVVFKIFQHELCSSIPNHQFLDMNSHFLTNLAVSRNHEITVVSQTNIFSSFARDLCSTAQLFVHTDMSSVQRSKQTVFIKPSKCQGPPSRMLSPLADRWNLPSPAPYRPKFNRNVFTAAPVSKSILTHSDHSGLLMAPRSKLPPCDGELAEFPYV